MNDLPIVERHYSRSPNIVVRTASDISAEGASRKVLASSLLDELRQPRPDSPGLVSSAQGMFDRILLTIPFYAIESEESNPYAAVYKDLLKKLPHSVKLIVMTHEKTKDAIENWLKDAKLFENSTIIEAPDHLNFSVWAEDGYAIIKDDQNKNTYFMEPYQFPRYADGLISNYVSNATDIKNFQAPLYFQGGNLLIGDTFFMIGADYPARTMDYVDKVIFIPQGKTPADAIKSMYGEYLDTKRDLIYVGSTVPVSTQQTVPLPGMPGWKQTIYFGNHEGTVQPMFHIDMFITLAGRNPDTGKYILVIGDPRLASDILRDKSFLPYSMSEVFDNIAASLERTGKFEVKRNPLPLVYMDDVENKQRIWYFATSNNALVQISGSGEKTIWIPTYGHGNWSKLIATDEANKEIWESLGFKVNMLGDFHPFAENLGAVHCIKKYISRGN